MVTCPVCQRDVPETTTVECPFCKTSLTSSPEPRGSVFLKYVGAGGALLGTALFFALWKWGDAALFDLRHYLLFPSIGLNVMGLACYARAQGYPLVWSVLGLVPIGGALVGLTDLTPRARTDTVSPDLKWCGMGLLLLFWAWCDWLVIGSSTDNDNVKLVALLLYASPFPMLGVALYAAGRGRSPLIGCWALLPGGIGQIIGLIVATKASSKLPSARWEWGLMGGISFAVLAFLAIVIPSYLSYPVRSRQAEARTNLAGIYVAEKAFYEEHKRYGTLDEIGFTVPGANRYTYRIDVSGKPGTVIPASIGQVTSDNTVVSARLSHDGQHFTATATANIDNDSTIDQWHVNDARQGLEKADEDDTNE